MRTRLIWSHWRIFNEGFCVSQLWSFYFLSNNDSWPWPQAGWTAPQWSRTAQLQPGLAQLDSGLLLQALGLYILQALKHRELRTQEAVQHLPSVAVAIEVEFRPKTQNGRQKCTKYKITWPCGCHNRLSQNWRGLSIRNLLSDDSAGLTPRIGFNGQGCPSLQILGESALASWSCGGSQNSFFVLSWVLWLYCLFFLCLVSGQPLHVKDTFVYRDLLGFPNFHLIAFVKPLHPTPQLVKKHL